MKIKGIKKIAGERKNLAPNCYLQLNYDMKTHKAWTNFLYGFGYNSWVVYHDDNVINCGNISRPKTMKEIEEIIINKVNEIQMYKAYEGRYL